MFVEYTETGEVPVDYLYDPTRAGSNPVKWLCGQWWNCADIMPSEFCADLDLPRGSTYAVAARQQMEKQSIR